MYAGTLSVISKRKFKYFRDLGHVYKTKTVSGCNSKEFDRLRNLHNFSNQRF